MPSANTSQRRQCKLLLPEVFKVALRKYLRRGFIPAIAILCASCTKHRPVVFSFLSTPSEGWEQTDTLRFPIDTISEGGTYLLSIALRTSKAEPYPFRSLSLSLCERLSPQPTRNKSLHIMPEAHPATPEAHGVSLQQNIFPADTIVIPANTVSGEVLISHQMQSRLLHGIRDIGIRLEKIR